LPPDLRITVVMGSHAPWLAQVQAKSTHMHWPTKVLVGVSNMAQLMAESDLCIGAVGSTSWERCCLGLPTIQLVLAANQKEAAMALAQMGVALSINASERLADDLRDLMARVDSQLMGTLTGQSAAICNGRGSSDVIRHLLKF
jgi:spore coat polysaccharide biosynthesis predicted glycosyltransferase SpsG